MLVRDRRTAGSTEVQAATSTSRRASSRRSCAAARFTEAPDITARICGICPVAYQMSSVHAMEQACGVEVGGQLRALRRLLYCGEWIESHALHVFMLHAPDFLGYESAIELAARPPRARRAGARAEEDRQRADDGRRRARGAPDQRARRRLVPRAAQARAGARSSRSSSARARSRSTAVRVTAGFDFPDYEQDYELVALAEPGEYPIDRGRIVSNRGLDIAVAEYDEHFVEEHVAWSNALHSRGRSSAAPTSAGRSPASRSRSTGSRRSRGRRPREAGLDPSERNPFRSIVVRCGRARLRRRRGAAPDRRVRGARRAGRRGRAARRRRLRLHRGAARDPLPPLRDRRRGHDPRREDRAADLAEPAHDRGGPARRRRALARPARRRARAPVRADDPQLRPVHLVRDALPEARGRAALKVIGVGNPLAQRRRRRARGGAPPARARSPAGVELLEREGEPTALIDAWEGADARLARRRGLLRRRARHGAPPRREQRGAARPSSSARSTHHVGLAEAVELARALGRLPRADDRLRDRRRAASRSATSSRRRSRRRSSRDADCRASGGGVMHERALMDDLMRKIEAQATCRGRHARDADPGAPRRALALHGRATSASTSRTPRAGRSPRARRSRPSSRTDPTEPTAPRASCSSRSTSSCKRRRSSTCRS